MSILILKVIECIIYVNVFLIGNWIVWELDCIKFNSIVLNGNKMRKRIIVRGEYVYKYGLWKKKVFFII